MNTTDYSLHSIPNGREGIRATLKFMSKITKQYKKEPIIRELAMRITSKLSQKNYPAEVRAMHEFVKERIRYVKDIRFVETIQTPIKTLQLGAGDCDDKSVLIATLLEAIGHPTRFIAVGFSGKSLTHVLTQTKIGDKWVSLETTEPVACGWHPPNVKNYMIEHN